ncbi:MAG: polysaccharide biosynthesis protein, partial [Pseudomonadota bacterium]
IIINAAALKQVPTCERFPEEAVKTNVNGMINLINAIQQLDSPPSTVIGISTDKASHPVNVMGLTKSLQEKILISANLKCTKTRFIAVRYGNILASRGSVLPTFHEQIKRNEPITITDARCTRFFLSLDDAISVIMYAYEYANAGEIIVPKIQACNLLSLAKCLAGKKHLISQEIGCRPGEKIHEVLVTEDELERTIELDSFFVISPVLKTLTSSVKAKKPTKAYTSEQYLFSDDELLSFLKRNKMTLEDNPEFVH